jgi:beta-N-acetylhexosaminidase
MYKRAIDVDENVTSEFARKVVKQMNEDNVLSSLKHFPGYGDNVDTHTGIAIDERSYENFKENDFLPFEAGIKEDAPCILVSHNIVKSMDTEYPASLSEKVIKELRNTLHYDGVVITDDLAMDAVKSYVEDGRAATLAVKAGNDMIITSDFETMYNEILESVKEKRLSEELIDKAVLRVLQWKENSGLL